ncbi:MAG TPA: hypothetical protein VKT82_33760 [Ktedonobacterales bacterium]|nr:hypothetical protein [Ktedonobacterales bacterium]
MPNPGGTITSSSDRNVKREERDTRFLRGQVGRSLRQVGQRLKDDWQGPRYAISGLALLLVSSLIVFAYYSNHPTPETYPDSAQYLAVSHQIMTSGKLVDPMRLPGYPLLISLVFLLTGQGNLVAVSIVQGILFVVAVLEIYIIVCLLTHRAWQGLIVGLLVTSNTYLLTFIKPILSEGFSLWIVTSLALAILLFLRTLRVRQFWLVVLLLFVAYMVRPEWIYAPVLLFAFLLLVAARHGRFRRLAPHVLAALLVLYGVLGLYIYENATLNGFAGVSVVERINLLGKVLQYNMQNEASPQYAALTQELDAFKQAYHQSKSPYLFADLHPAITANYWALPDAYDNSIVEHHPIEFVMNTVPIFFSTLDAYYAESRLDAKGPFGNELVLLDNISLKTVLLYQLFPFFALVWLVLLFWRRTARSLLVEMMAALSLIGLYELVLIASGGYEAYARLHSAFNPILTVVVCGSVLLALAFSARLLMKSATLTTTFARLWPGVYRIGGTFIIICVLASAALTVFTRGFSTLGHLTAWRGVSYVYKHPTPSGVVLAVALCLLLVLWYYSYQAHQFRQAQSARGTPENGPLAHHLTPAEENRVSSG